VIVLKLTGNNAHHVYLGLSDRKKIVKKSQYARGNTRAAPCGKIRLDVAIRGRQKWADKLEMAHAFGNFSAISVARSPIIQVLAHAVKNQEMMPRDFPR